MSSEPQSSPTSDSAVASSIAPNQVASAPKMCQVYCSTCSVMLSYPEGATCIQCPKCSNTMNPALPQQTYCINCNALLAHPPNSLYIQCPKCLSTMNVREQPKAKNPSVERAPAKQKKKKDPLAPRSASNAYMIFCKERRPQFAEEHPELPFGQIGAKLGEIWRGMTPDEKKPYEDRASADRERYRREMEAYQNEHATPRGTKRGLEEGGEGAPTESPDSMPMFSIPGLPGVTFSPQQLQQLLPQQGDSQTFLQQIAAVAAASAASLPLQQQQLLLQQLLQAPLANAAASGSSAASSPSAGETSAGAPTSPATDASPEPPAKKQKSGEGEEAVPAPEASTPEGPSP